MRCCGQGTSPWTTTPRLHGRDAAFRVCGGWSPEVDLAWSPPWDLEWMDVFQMDRYIRWVDIDIESWEWWIDMRDSLNRAWLEIPISCSCFFPAINLHFSRRFPSLICPLQSPEAVYYDAAAANHMEASGFPRFMEKRWNPGDHFQLISEKSWEEPTYFL
jgi:hypothetical protein